MLLEMFNLERVGLIFNIYFLVVRFNLVLIFGDFLLND